MAEAARPLEPEIFAGHVELAAEALDGIAFQSGAAARFLDRGDYIAALAAYRRAVELHRNFAIPHMRIVDKEMAIEKEAISC